MSGCAKGRNIPPMSAPVAGSNDGDPFRCVVCEWSLWGLSVAVPVLFVGLFGAAKRCETGVPGWIL